MPLFVSGAVQVVLPKKTPENENRPLNPILIEPMDEKPNDRPENVKRQKGSGCGMTIIVMLIFVAAPIYNFIQEKIQIKRYAQERQIEAEELEKRRHQVVKILDYLYVYPEDLGKLTYKEALEFINVIKHGYSDWRLPTIAEWRLIGANYKEVEI